MRIVRFLPTTLFATWLAAFGGCATIEQGRLQSEQEKTLALTRQNQDIFTRAETLSKDNEQQQMIIAQADQAKKQAEAKMAEVQQQAEQLTAEVARLQSELQAKEQTVQSLNASFQKQATVTITPNNSLLKQTPVIPLDGVSVLPRDGETIRVAVNDSVLFHPGTTQLLPDAEKVLGTVINEIRTNYPTNTIGIEGHTDSLAENPQNPMQAVEQSSRKASVIAQYLLDQKRLSTKQIKVVGYGAARPILDNKTPEGRDRNNRVEFVVYP